MTNIKKTIQDLQTKCGAKGNHNPNSVPMIKLWEQVLTWTSHPEEGRQITMAILQCEKCMFVFKRYHYTDIMDSTPAWHTSTPVIYPVNIQGVWV